MWRSEMGRLRSRWAVVAALILRAALEAWNVRENVGIIGGPRDSRPLRR
jgi:hypothetical protein